MKRVIGNATLYHGDCRDILPMIGKVDAVVTDPPYGIGANKHAGKAENGWTQWEGAEWDNERPASEVFEAILAYSKHQIIWGGNYFTDFLPPTMQWLVWDKGQRNFSLADCEFAWSSQHKAARIFTLPRAKALQDGKVHPTQKSIELMEWCLDFVKDARTICDPFMGSGTTGIACRLRGKSFIGIEREKKYFDIACERIEAAQMQTSMFVDAPPARPAAMDQVGLSF